MHIRVGDEIAPHVKRVLLNGADVTSLTTEVDTTEGWVEMMLMGTDGQPVMDASGTKPVTLKIYGRVTIGMRQHYPCHFCLMVFDAPGPWARHIKSHEFVPN